MIRQPPRYVPRLIARNQQDETERGIVRHNVSVLKRFSDTAALTRLAARGLR
jgi:hypothetical protein